MLIIDVEVLGKKYKLQHPGNREWLQLQQSMLVYSTDGKAHLDIVPLLDYFFEHVCIPLEEGAPKLSIDTISLEDLEVWSSLAPTFLAGKYKLPKQDSIQTEDKAPAIVEQPAPAGHPMAGRGARIPGK